MSISQPMRYVEYVSGGTPTQMSIQDGTLSPPKANQVTVKVQAFGVNRADTLQRQGKYPAPAGESTILGLEVAGRVTALGDKADNWKVGDMVFGLVAGGGYAEYVNVDQTHLITKPENVDFSSAAGIAEVFLTAYQSLFTIANLQPGHRVLIHAGASGVGLAAIQLAKRHGCQVAVTSSTATKLAQCKNTGADLLINYKQQDFVEVLTEQKFSADVIIDFVAADYVNRNLKVLNLDGVIIHLALLGGRYTEPLDMAQVLTKRAKIMGSTLRSRTDQYKTQLIADFNRDCLAGFNSGELSATIDTVINAEDIAQAHLRLENNDTMGKLIGIWEK
ncbi:NAD(P)H-quinone oxidoreductase [Aliiglaciecola sp. LCG003]|uniref:NAD(P)H-quinone oxidoreductase n=1 Tax=Aliiglaciecola sp. LCG003 TaxID=3053655 RepID=UPI002572323A|nr:NAD(P)H-quinone oxidoreductase [Aliiglaciecola sp. LCG003]WJG07859.1 NAD(P)H-quinone oxidoreductase [Aliiglaciecola sp. LCG003]